MCDSVAPRMSDLSTELFSIRKEVNEASEPSLLL